MIENSKPLLKKWCIIGAFSKTLKGGTSTFCNLVFEKDYFYEFDFFRIDSTLDIIPKDLPFIRIRKSFIKFSKFFSCIIQFKPLGVMLFAGHGWGLLEKFVILLFSKILGKKIIFFPRSGLILTSRFDKLIFYFSVYFSDRVICQSQFWETYVIGLNSGFKKKAIIIYNGIQPENKEIFAKQPNTGKFVILYAGWLEPYKGILDLIEVVKFLNNSGNGAYELNIIGKGSLEFKIHKIIENNPKSNISYQGWISGEEKSDFFEKSDCLVLPSYYEGFPNVVLEAINTNLPVICSNTTSLPEILDDGNCGILFSAGNQKELIEAILKVQNFPNEAQNRVLKAKERVKSKFDIEISKRQLKEVLMSF